MIRNFNDRERSLLLKFITGAGRLMQTQTVRVDLKSHWNDDKFPIAHTCGYSVDCPSYSTQEIMEKKYRIAIEMCGEIDDDGDYMDDYGGSSSGRGHSSDEDRSGSASRQ